MTFSTLQSIVRHWAGSRPHAAAFHSPIGSWTYLELETESRRVANGLMSIGVAAGDRVGSLTRHTAECVVLILAAARIGAVCTPLNWRLAARELEFVINHSGARLLIVDQAFQATLEEIRIPRVELRLRTEPGHTDSFAHWASAFNANDVDEKFELENTVLQLYSSGTTGLPKGVEITHTNLMFQFNAIAEYFDYRSGHAVVLLDALPNFHVSGIVNTLAVLHEGFSVVTRHEFVANDILTAIDQHNVTNSFMVPTMIRLLAQAIAEKGISLPSLRTIGYGGSPVSESFLRDVGVVLKCELIQVYGMTELSGMVTCLSAADHSQTSLLRSAGRPLEGVSLRVVDLSDGHECGDSEVGEVWVRAGSVMKSYFNDSKATDETLVFAGDGRWMRTGDIGEVKSGYLFLRDRLKEMVISGGENIYPAEVENVIAGCAAVADVAVIGVPDALWGEAVKACVVLRAGANCSGVDIIDFARTRLAHYKCPKSVDFFQALPRNASGKLLKRILREPYWTKA